MMKNVRDSAPTLLAVLVAFGLLAALSHVMVDAARSWSDGDRATVRFLARPAASAQTARGTLRVRAAASQAALEQGLVGSPALTGDEAMLYPLVPRRAHGFWMKDMTFGVDRIWIRAGKVVRVDADVRPPAPRTPDRQIPVARAPGAVDFVVEARAGWAAEHDVRAGLHVDVRRGSS